MTILKLLNVNEAAACKESYGLVKKKIFDGNDFFEVTVAGNKVCFNKVNIEFFQGITDKVKVAVKVEETKTKVAEVKKKLKKWAN